MDLLSQLMRLTNSFSQFHKLMPQERSTFSVQQKIHGVLARGLVKFSGMARREQWWPYYVHCVNKGIPQSPYL